MKPQTHLFITSLVLLFAALVAAGCQTNSPPATTALPTEPTAAASLTPRPTNAPTLTNLPTPVSTSELALDSSNGSQTTSTTTPESSSDNMPVQPEEPVQPTEELIPDEPGVGEGVANPHAFETSYGTYTVLGTVLHYEDQNGQWMPVTFNQEVQESLSPEVNGPVVGYQTTTTKDNQSILVGLNAEGQQVIAYDRSRGEFVRTFFKNFRNMGDVTILVPVDQVDVNTDLRDEDIVQQVEVTHIPALEIAPEAEAAEFNHMYVFKVIVDKNKFSSNSPDTSPYEFFLASVVFKYRDENGIIQDRRVHFRNADQIGISSNTANHFSLPQNLFSVLVEGATSVDQTDGWVNDVNLRLGFKVGDFPTGYMRDFNELDKITLGSTIASSLNGSFNQAKEDFLHSSVDISTIQDPIYGAAIYVPR